MSGEAEGWTYDPVELGRRVVFAFSAGELQKFAEQLGVAAQVRWDRGHAEAARDVVRQFEKSYGGLPTLVDRLRAVKPLVEWPEPGPPPSQAVASRRADNAAPASIQHQFAAAPPLASPGSLGGPPGPTIPGAPAFAPAPAAVSSAPAASAPAAPAVAAQPPPPSTPYAPPPGGFAPPGGWPGTIAAAPQKAPSTGLDPRILVAVAGLMVVAAVIAYFAGRAGNTSAPTAAASAPADGTAAPARRADGPATRLASEIDRGVANVARACEVPNGSAEEVFSRAFEQCGPSDPQRPTPHRTSPFPLPRETAAPPEPRVRTAGPDTRPREAPGAACTKACAAETNACRSRCGPEPSEASRYGSYQQCMGHCISAASKCRLGCP